MELTQIGKFITELFDVSINEILSGKRLSKEEYKEAAGNRRNRRLANSNTIQYSILKKG